jgi:hypothetical protein
LGWEGAPPNLDPLHHVYHLKVQPIGPWSSLISWHHGSSSHP